MTNIDTIREALNSKFKDSQWVAYEASNGDTETFETYDQAKAWLDGFNDDGISEETEQGYSYIAKITHRTAMEITDRKENYHQHTDSCGELTDECDEETWPYDDEYDYVGRVNMVALAALSTIDPEPHCFEINKAINEISKLTGEDFHGYRSEIYRVLSGLEGVSPAHDNAIRREAVSKAIEYIDSNHNDGLQWDRHDFDALRAAILDTEPAREES